MDARRWRSLFVAARPGRMKAAGRWGHSRASVRSAPIRDQRKSRDLQGCREHRIVSGTRSARDTLPVQQAGARAREAPLTKPLTVMALS